MRDGGNSASWYGQRLLQVGVALLLFSGFEGFAIPHLASPRLGLSVHTLSAFEGVLLVVLGLLWTRLSLGATAAWVAFWLMLYSNVAILAAYLMAAAWGAGNQTIPLAAGPAHGTTFQEAVIRITAYSSALGLVSFALVLWGLRSTEARSE
jgi:(hydroxyamino)benzene mutase